MNKKEVLNKLKNRTVPAISEHLDKNVTGLILYVASTDGTGAHKRLGDMQGDAFQAIDLAFQAIDDAVGEIDNSSLNRKQRKEIKCSLAESMRDFAKKLS